MADTAGDPPELAPIRAGEEFDIAAVEAYVKARIPDLQGSMRAQQFPGGHANLTYLLQFDDRELVLRRPPLGPIAPRSHDMAREYKVLSALGDSFEQAPHAYLLCEDPSVIGAIFFVMERCRGTVVRTELPQDFENVDNVRERMSHTLIDVMADFHDLDYEKLGLGDLGKPEGFVERQVHGWKGRWDNATDTELPLYGRVYDWLVANLPSSPGASPVHNDLKFDNAMFETGNPDHIVALLDWDMTTLGDPLVDLGTLLGYWPEAGDPPERGGTNALTAQPGFPTRAQISERYARRRNIPLETIAWYESFALWKTAAVLQQIYIRYVRGQTSDERFAEMGKRVPMLVGFAADVVGVERD